MARSLRDLVASGEATAAPVQRSGRLAQMVASGAATAETAPSKLDSFGRGGLQGATLGFGDELAGGITAALQGGVNLLPESVQRRFDLVPAGAGDAYRYSRDEERAANTAAQNANAKTYLLGNVLGGMATGRFIPVPAGAAKPGATLLARLGQAVKQGAATGATQGAVGGFGASEADLLGGELGQAAKDTAAGAALGGVFGAGLPAAQVLGVAGAKAAPALLRGLGQRLTGAGTRLGRRALMSGSDTLSKRRPVSDAAVQEAIKSGAILPFGTTQGALKRLEGLTDEVGAQYGDIVEGLAERGVEGLNVAKAADKLDELAQREFYSTGANKSTAKILENEASNLREVAMGLPTLALKQGEQIKRNLQARARYNLVEEPLENEVRREAASVVRQAQEDAIQEAAGRTLDPEIVERAESFVPVKQRLGRLLEAESAAARGASAAGKRGAVSLTDLGMGAAVGGGEPVAGATAILLNKLARARGPSTGASALYWGGRGVSSLANKAAQELPAAPGRALLAGERALLDEWLNTGSEAREQAEALRRRRRR